MGLGGGSLGASSEGAAAPRRRARRLGEARRSLSHLEEARLNLGGLRLGLVGEEVESDAALVLVLRSEAKADDGDGGGVVGQAVVGGDEGGELSIDLLVRIVCTAANEERRVA